MGNTVLPKMMAQLIDLIPYFRNQKTERLVRVLTQLRYMTQAELLVLGLEGLIVGYYLMNVILLFRDNL